MRYKALCSTVAVIFLILCPIKVHTEQCVYLFQREYFQPANEIEYVTMPQNVVRAFGKAGLRGVNLRKVIHVTMISLQIAYEELEWYKSYSAGYNNDAHFLLENYSKNFWSKIENLDIHASPGFKYTIEQVHKSSTAVVSKMIDYAEAYTRYLNLPPPPPWGLDRIKFLLQSIQKPNARAVELAEQEFWSETMRELERINYGVVSN